VLEGAARANVRVLVQSGWSRIDDDWFTATAKLVSHEILMAQEASSPKATQEKGKFHPLRNVVVNIIVFVFVE
jgi:sarcosine oxidase delta subunit